MLAIGYKCNYASYDFETSLLQKIGVRFQHVERFDEIETAADVLAIFVRQEEIDASIMDQFANLRIIQRYGVGTDNVDTNAAKQRGILVCNTPQYGQEQEVSTHAVALYLSLSRRVLTRDKDVRSGRWDIGQNELILGDQGLTLGLVGFGQIARAARAKFEALGFGKTIVLDPAVSAEAAKAASVEIVTREELAARSDVISLHAPLNGNTKHMINAEFLRLCKKSAYIINVARGGLVDEQALSAALASGRLAGAGIDVFEREPPQPGSPLFSSPNTVLTDHMAWYSENAIANLQREASQEVVRVLSGQPALNACA